MPRKKMIDESKIRWGKIDTAIIKEKNCLQAELLLREQLTPWSAHTLQSCCKFSISEDRKQVSFPLKNSWKGLIMACLSIAYCKYGTDIVKKLLESEQYYITQASFTYDHLQGAVIEQIYAPLSWKPCYVTATYKLEKIYTCFERLEKLLGLNRSESVITTEYAVEPLLFKDSPVTFPLETGRWRVSDFLLDCVEGIACVSDETMDKLFGNRLAMGAPYQLKPQDIALWSSEYDDPGRPVPLFGYEISTATIGYLYTYFPYLKTNFQTLASDPNLSWVVFDRKHLGKWG